MKYTIEINGSTTLTDNIKSPEDFVKLIDDLELEVFQDWSYTKAAFQYYLETLVRDGGEIAGEDDTEGRELLRKAINIFTELLDK